MTMKAFPIAALLVSLGASVDAKVIGFSAVFTGDNLSELYTADAEICEDVDGGCNIPGFTVPETLRSPLAPFAGLSTGTRLPFRFDLDESSGVECAIGSYFECSGLEGVNEKLDSTGQLVGFEVFDFWGDYDVRVDLAGQSVDFFGAAGSFLPGGCTAEEGAEKGLPEGFCDFFGYEANFEIVADGAVAFAADDVAVVPLNASILFSLFGVTALAAARRVKKT
ncbi:hypothetical protein KX928_20920 [Roseobacter sp. YSTF-M11]|uniref:PEP-CTERM protein-sorting domain-containing protein n=1 Tax=Roseobacter insulae TaxID=2859783 RepID=A0A9X1G0G9_9RHOB|nr:hypothetical protein [Roseobacter insulae]MBW4710258.1 hypothetical protein [Roseobacter insulae]